MAKSLYSRQFSWECYYIIEEELAASTNSSLVEQELDTKTIIITEDIDPFLYLKIEQNLSKNVEQ